MTRDAARQALDRAFAARIEHMFTILADSFGGSVNAITTAKSNFANGISRSLEAHAFAVSVTDETFKGES